MLDFIKKSRNVYNVLQDELSKKIFLARSDYSLSGDVKYMRPIFMENELSKDLYNLSLGNNDYIFGCGYYGEYLRKCLQNNWRGFIDNNQELWGEKDGLKVVSIEDVEKNARIFIANRYHHKEIYSQLLDKGFIDEQIINVGSIIEEMAAEQYFDLQHIVPSEDEIFADVGALNGDTSKAFIEWCGGEYKHIYCFEPDVRNIDKCRMNLSREMEKKKVTLIPKGAWSSSGVLSFVQQANGTSMIGPDGDTCIETIALDEALKEKRVTFIKMDIEGAEYPALQAAKNVIKKGKPKLAISVYHCPEDIFRIPEIILQYNPSYRLFLRHYSPFENETILYAI